LSVSAEYSVVVTCVKGVAPSQAFACRVTGSIRSVAAAAIIKKRMAFTPHYL
jgi:hypothetical protein